MTPQAVPFLTRFLLPVVRTAVLWGGLACCLPVTARAEDPASPAPTPAAVSGKRWTLGFTHGPLRRVLVDDGSGRETTYLYMTVTVENQTGLPRPWRPLVTAKVDTRAEPYVAGGFPSAIALIRHQEGNEALVAMESSWGVGDAGKLAVGDKKQFVAVFGPVDPGWASFHIEVQGLVDPLVSYKVLSYKPDAAEVRSGTDDPLDMQVVLEPAYAAHNAQVMDALRKANPDGNIPKPTPSYRYYIEKRVWSMDYRREGDEFRPDDDPILFAGESWKVVGSPKYIRTVKAAG